jgi:uncharacterized Zn finger protein (UPF0148 family)
MSAGLFEMTCPVCSTELEMVATGHVSCPNCGRDYLHKFGHLIPVPTDVHEPATSVATLR